MRYKSGLELEFYKLLDEDNSVLSYEAEPVIIPYTYEGRTHSYFIDLKVTYKDSSVKLVEIKPEYLLLDPQNQAKFSASKSLYDNFEIWTENDLS